MREDEFDEILRTPQGQNRAPPNLDKQARRRQTKVANLIIVLVLVGLVIIPVALARAGDPLQLLLGFALGDPFGF